VYWGPEAYTEINSEAGPWGEARMRIIWKGEGRARGLQDPSAVPGRVYCGARGVPGERSEIPEQLAPPKAGYVTREYGVPSSFQGVSGPVRAECHTSILTRCCGQSEARTVLHRRKPVSRCLTSVWVGLAQDTSDQNVDENQTGVKHQFLNFKLVARIALRNPLDEALNC